MNDKQKDFKKNPYYKNSAGGIKIVPTDLIEKECSDIKNEKCKKETCTCGGNCKKKK